MSESGTVEQLRTSKMLLPSIWVEMKRFKSKAALLYRRVSAVVTDLYTEISLLKHDPITQATVCLNGEYYQLHSGFCFPRDYTKITTDLHQV